jgi:hypothetical protein
MEEKKYSISVRDIKNSKTYRLGSEGKLVRLKIYAVPFNDKATAEDVCKNINDNYAGEYSAKVIEY